MTLFQKVSIGGAIGITLTAWAVAHGGDYAAAAYGQTLAITMYLVAQEWEN